MQAHALRLCAGRLACGLADFACSMYGTRNSGGTHPQAVCFRFRYFAAVPLPPALDQTARLQHRTGVPPPRGQLHGRQPRPQVHSGEGGAHLPGVVATVVGVPLAKPALAVQPASVRSGCVNGCYMRAGGVLQVACCSTGVHKGVQDRHLCVQSATRTVKVGASCMPTWCLRRGALPSWHPVPQIHPCLTPSSAPRSLAAAARR